jgi:hypothetical protein
MKLPNPIFSALRRILVRFPIIAEELGEAQDAFPDEWITEAFRIAVDKTNAPGVMCSDPGTLATKDIMAKKNQKIDEALRARRIH